jgi:hypothetical protein
MKHLDDDAALALAEGQTQPQASRHAEACSACAQRVARYRTLLELLADAAATPPPARVVSWARAYARTQAAPRRRWSVLLFLTEGMPATASVRGGHALTTALLFGDERFHLDLRVNPAAGNRVLLHGQVVPLTPAAPGAWEVIAVTDDGRLLRTTADPLGEFWLEAGPRWHEASLIAVSAGERLVVPRLGGSETGASAE